MRDMMAKGLGKKGSTVSSVTSEAEESHCASDTSVVSDVDSDTCAWGALTELLWRDGEVARIAMGQDAGCHDFNSPTVERI